MNSSQSVGPATAVRLIAQRELNAKLRTRSFVIGTTVILVVIIGYLLLQSTLSGSAEKSRIGLFGQATGISEQLEAGGDQLGAKIETSTITDQKSINEQLDSGDLDAVVSGNAANLQVLVKSELKDDLQPVLNAVSQQQVLNAKLVEAGQDPAQVMADVDNAKVDVVPLNPKDSDSQQRLAIGVIMVLLLYMSVITYGSMVAQGVVEEKSSRVVEILLSTVRPWHLLLGKVIGLGLVGLVQLLIIAGVGAAVASATGVLTLSGVAAGTILNGLVWYILGFFLYATIYAASGSLVSRQEEAQSVLTPINMVLVIGFVVGFNLLLQDPDGTAAMVLSLIPLLSPILMPGRIAAATASGWEIGVAVVLTVAAIALFTWLGGKIYHNAVLRTGSRIKVTDALRG